MKTAAPIEHAVQLSGQDGKGRPILSVIAKRTYRLERRRSPRTADCILSDEQLPLQPLTVDEAQPELVVQDSDTAPWKPLTDVVVRGHAYCPGSAAEFTASVSVGAVTKALAIIGDRRCALSATGRVVFGEPAPFEKMPLRYDRAYGGIDTVALAKHGDPFAALLPYISPHLRTARHGPYRYPRNGAGRGYVIDATAEALEALALPNIEDPSDRLSPSRLAVGSVGRWPRMPLPWGTDWSSFACFPRIGYLGGTPAHEPFEGPFPEVRRGFMPEGFPRMGGPPEAWHDRACNAGSFGLQVGPVTSQGAGTVELRLLNMHPRAQSLSFHLPAEGPKISVDGRDGTLLPTAPAVHHVVIEPDLDRVSVVWRGSAPAVRRYLPHELEKMPFSVEW